MIKPDFFTSDQLSESSLSARLLFIGMWCFCDDGGNHPDSPKRLKMEIYPGDDYSTDQVQDMIDELVGNKLICRYEVDGERFLHVLGWSKHQTINRPTFKHPSYTPQAHLSEPSVSALTERKGKERKGKSTTATSLPRFDDNFEKFKKAYPKRAGSQPWSRAKKAIRARLKSGVTWTDLIAGVERYAEWCELTDKLNTETVMQAATFCGPDEHFRNPWDVAPSSGDEPPEWYGRLKSEGVL